MSKLFLAIKMNFDIKCLQHEKKQYLGDIFINLDLNYQSLEGYIGSNCRKDEPINIIFE